LPNRMRNRKLLHDLCQRLNSSPPMSVLACLVLLVRLVILAVLRSGRSRDHVGRAAGLAARRVH